MHLSRARLRSVVARSFIPDAIVTEIAWAEDLDLVICWPRGRAARQPLPARMIHSTIERQVIEAYAAARASKRYIAERQLQGHLHVRMMRFDPDQPLLLGREQPVVRWLIAPDVLISTCATTGPGQDTRS